MTSRAQADRSNGWEAVATRLIAERSHIGTVTVRSWCRALPTGASVLDLGCGSGVPVSETLINESCVVAGVDASPTLVTAFQRRFPHAQVICEAAEDSDFFGRTYDGVVAIGLIFLLEPEVQRAVIRRVASALKPRGRFLFTAPTQMGTWVDFMTGRQSMSLGDDAYRSALRDAGLVVIAEYVDEGESHYYDTGHSEPEGAPVAV